MKKNGPRKIVYTEYNCMPCRHLKELKNSIFSCDHPKLIRSFRSINIKLNTPNWCPVLNARN